MNDNIKQTLDKILAAFESGQIPEAIAIASFPIPEGLPSFKWSIRNRTIMALSGTIDARGFNQWKEVNRYIIKGSKCIHILVPCFKKEDDEAGEGEEERVLGVIKHWDEICHRILSNATTPNVLRHKSTSHFKSLAAPIILEVKTQ